MNSLQINIHFKFNKNPTNKKSHKKFFFIKNI